VLSWQVAYARLLLAPLLQRTRPCVLDSRFLAEPGKLVLHQGVRKAGLMGFCDVAPGEMKHLRVAYLSAGRPHVALLTDMQVDYNHC
jgi:Domain of unknown function (DUF3395)